MLPVEAPFKTYTGLDGKPLNNGYVYFGLPNENPITSPVEVYWDVDGTIPAAQPLRTVNGYIMRAGTPANVYCDDVYSELVRDSKARQVFYARTSADFSIASTALTFITNLTSAIGSSLIGFLQEGVGAIKRTVQDKLRDFVSVKDFGAVGDGTADDTAAIQKAINTGRAVKLNNGTFKITSPLSLTSARFYGEGPARSRIYAFGCHAFTIAPDAGLSRPACIVEGIGISSPSLNCDDKYAFYVPGVAANVAPVYNSGFTVRDVEIGADGRMGGGFYFKDLFRANVENVGLSHVSYMIHLVGSVVQCKFRNVTSNNNSPGSLLSNHGIGTESAVYDGGKIYTPENIRAIDCASIRCDRGIHHTAGLDIEFINFDTEAKYYGAFINASCIMRGGILAPSGSGTFTTWVGLYRGSNAANIGDATVFDGVDVNMLTTTTNPAGSIGIDLGDGTSPVNGLTVVNTRVRGVAGSLATAIRGRNLNDATLEDNFVIKEVATGNAVSLTGTGIWFDRNRIHYGNVTIADNGSATALGSVCNNQLASLSFAPTNPANWKVSGNLSGEMPLWHGLRMLGGVMMQKATSLVSGVDVAQFESAAAMYAITASGFSAANSAACALKVGSQTGGRSINAVGTINASGADYAEYENNNGLVIDKGAVVGFKADGTLTLTYSEAVRFGVKSTAPSYVGGDTWGNPDAIGGRPDDPALVPAFLAKLEAARLRVDRVAYAGKVPVNVLGAAPGGYIIAANSSGKIIGQYVATPTFDQYRTAVGRVNRITSDGRAEIAVMIH